MRVDDSDPVTTQGKLRPRPNMNGRSRIAKEAPATAEPARAAAAAASLEEAIDAFERFANRHAARARRLTSTVDVIGPAPIPGKPRN